MGRRKKQDAESQSKKAAMLAKKIEQLHGEHPDMGTAGFGTPLPMTRESR